MIKIGCHVKFTKSNNYLLGSLNEALSYDANCFMIFLGAPHNTIRGNANEFKINEFNQELIKNNLNINNVIIHLPYIANMANITKPGVFDFSVEFLIKELKLANAIGINKLVLHPGSKLDGDLIESLNSLINGINKIIDSTNSFKSVICLETMSGKGNEIGINFDQIAYIINGVKNKTRIGVCFDTCHLHDSGYDLSNFDKILDEFDEKIGIQYLKAIHLNDSKNELGSKKDRHENIGLGKIGFDNLISIVYNKRVEHIVKILETPYLNNQAIYGKEIKMIKNKKQLID